MYLIVIAWFYVTAMMAIAEASSPQGSILGACITFALYGLLPMSILIYIFATPERKRKLKALRATQQQAYEQAQAAQPPITPNAPSSLPDTSSHSPCATEQRGISPMREK